MTPLQTTSAGVDSDTHARDRVRVVVLALAYLAAHNLAYQFLVPTGVLAAIWPAAGLALAVLLLTPRRWWPSMLAMLAVINLVASMSAGRSFAVGAGFVLVHFCETLVGAWLLTRGRSSRVTFERVGEVLSLVGVATLANTGVGLIAASTVYFNFGEPFWQVYRTWWISNGLGVLLVAPLVITWVDGWHLRRTLTWPVAAEAIVFFLAWVAATWKMFHAAPADGAFAPHPYMLLPLLAWAGMRLGQRTVTGALVVLAAIAVNAIARGTVQSPLGGATEAEALLLLQLYLGVTTVTGLLLAASLAQARHEVRERLAGEALLRQFVRHTPAAMAMFDTEMRYIQASDRWLADYNLTGAIVGRSHYDVVPGIPDRWRAVHDRVLNGAVERSDEDTFVRADGTTDWLQWELRPWRDGTGAIGGLIMFAQLITERKHAEQALQESDAQRRRVEEQLRQSQKMEAVGQLAGGVAHDFNNILSVIMMQAELAGAHEGVPDEVREYLSEIAVSANRAASLTRQLLAFSRRQVMQPRDIDLNDSVSHLARMLRRLLGEDVRLQLNLHAAPMVTYADPGMIDQVIMNLAVNARDAMPGGGRLIIETAVVDVTSEDLPATPVPVEGRYVCVRVSDTGEGIPRELMERIFEPFFTTKQPGKGTGLGLATVFGIVEQHRGAVRVYSEVGQGTTFHVLLPAKTGSTEEVLVPEARRPVPGGHETVLVVEDEKSIRALTRMILEQHGYVVLDADTGAAAMRRWDEHEGRIHLLLTDMVMPGGMTGRELAASLQARDPSLRLLFTSGYSAELAGQELALEEGHNFLQKPHGTAPLLEAVRHCLDG